MKNAARMKYALAASVAVVTFLVYLPALQNDFVNWDDDLYVMDNTHIRSLSPAFFKWIFTDFYASYWHPLTWVSHAVDYALWGLNPWGHHLTNIILHAVNSFLVVILIMRLLEAWSGMSQKAGQSAGFQSRELLIAGGTTGILFGLHPLHVESAAWVAERKDLLCALFFLLSILQYASYVRSVATESVQEHSFSRYRSKHYFIAIGFFILALCSKPMAVSLPVVLLILDWYPFDRIRSLKDFRTVFVEKIPFVLLSLISSIVIIVAQKTGGAMASIESIPLPTRLLVAARSLILYLVKMVWPLNLYPLYPYPANVSLGSFEYLSAIVLLSAITITGIVLAKKGTLWLAVWGYYVITLLPVLGIVQVGPQAMADRFFYLPSIGPFLLCGVGAAWLSNRTHRVEQHRLGIQLFIVAAALLVSAAMIVLTVRQIGLWKNGIILWSHVIEQEPAAYAAYNNRGVSFEKTGQIDRAFEDYNKTLALNPADAQAYFNLGVLYIGAHLFDKAIACLSQSIALKPERADAYHNRGVVYSSLDRLDEALADFNKAISLDRNLDIAYFNRGRLYLRLGNEGLAQADFQKACDLGYQDACMKLRE